MDINLNQIAQLIAIAEQANIDDLEISEGHRNIRITCRSAGCGYHHKHSHGLHHHSYHAYDHSYDTAQQDQTTALTSPVLFSKSTKPVSDLPPQAAQPQTQTTDNQSAATAETAQAATSSDNLDKSVTSPMVGTFYRKSSPDAPAFVEVGQQVAAGDTLCIIEAMKIMHEVKAEQAGVVREILVNDGDMVEYAQPILTIE